MALIFEIPALNPIRFVPDGYSGENRFDKSFAVELINSYQNKICYLQKWEQADTTKIQFLSDFADHEIFVHDLYTNEQVGQFTPVDTGVTLQDQTFKVYEAELAFATFPPGTYYMSLQYVNDLLQTVEHISEPFAVAEEWKETLLFTYKNSENNFSVVFGTGIEFNFRVEGNIEEFQPESDDVIYADQKHNLTQLSSIPFRSFTLFIADQRGVPAWVADRVNRIMSCDQTQIDDGHGKDYYEKAEGAAWESARASQYAWMGLQISIQPVENFFLLRLKQSDDDDMATIKIIRKANNYFNVNDTLSVPNVFNRYAVLDHVVIEKVGANFTLNIGTTAGASDIGSFEVTDPNTCITVRHYFRVATTVHLSGFPSAMPFVGLVWDEMDAREITIPTDNGLGGTLAEGAVIMYHASATQLNLDFDLTTGLGRADTGWTGWALCDGRNGTANMGGRMPLGYDAVNYPTLSVTGGEEEHLLTLAEMPEHAHKQGSESVFNFYGGGAFIGTRTLSPGVHNTYQEQNTEAVGGGAAHNNMPPYIVTLFVKKIS